MATIISPRDQSPANSSTPHIKSPSVADTPTSSTRNSLELNPRNSQVGVNSNAVPGPPQRRGNRAALRDYYNLKSKPSSTNHGPLPGQLSRTTSVTSTTSDFSTATSALNVPDSTTSTSTTSQLTSQLDSPNFEPTPYITSLLATSSLKEILKVEATLVSEIRNLDGERKALVYDNYSKLIKAVGTIGEMQRSMNASGGGLTSVGELDGKMEGLRSLVREIANPNRQGSSEGETQKGQVRRNARREAKEQERKRELVRWVLAAPARLKRLLAEGKRGEAEAEWKTLEEYLDHWGAVKGVAEVRTECEEIMEGSDSEHEHEDAQDDGKSNG